MTLLRNYIDYILNDLNLLSKDVELRDPKDLMPGTHKLIIEYVGSKFTLKIKEIVQVIVLICPSNV